MNNPLVSILIPFKNTSEFLSECITSIQQQSYKNWEVLAVNDHSSDNSLWVISNFATTDKRIKILENKGNGIIEALRLAYAHSHGELVTRMDSDDIMAPNKLAVMVNSLLHHGTGHLAIGQVRYFSNRGISNGYKQYEEWLNGLTSSGTNYSEIYKECVVPSPCWMTFRTDLDACEAFEPDRYPEDYDLTFRFYEKGLRCLPCNQILHFWRDYDHRTSRTSEHYAQNYFLDIKLHYFLLLDYDPDRPLVVWGAGNKGKTIAKMLDDRHIAFSWICDNPKKIGKEIYGHPMLPVTDLEKLYHPQSIVTVANPLAQKEIQTYLGEQGQKSMTDFFFFC